MFLGVVSPPDLHEDPDSEYIPGAHTTQAFVFSSNSRPASHCEQSFFLVFGAPDKPSSGHDLHSTEPNSKETFAPGHILQDDAVDAPSYGLNVPGAQSLHVLLASAPIAVENFPAVQLLHTVSEVAPIVELYLPAMQEWQPVEILYKTSK